MKWTLGFKLANCEDWLAQAQSGDFDVLLDATSVLPSSTAEAAIFPGTLSWWTREPVWVAETSRGNTQFHEETRKPLWRINKPKRTPYWQRSKQYGNSKRLPGYFAMQSTSFSDLYRLKECRIAWDFSSSLRYNRVARTTPMSLLRGAAWHRALATHYRTFKNPGGDAFEEAFQAEMKRDDEIRGSAEELIHQIEIGREVLAMYPKWAHKHDDWSEILEIEEHHYVPITDRVRFAYKPDMIVRRNGELWVHDFKTVGILPGADTSYLEFDDQLMAYMYATSQKYGEPCTKAIVTYLYVKMPAEPKVKQDGCISRANIYTTPEKYFDALLVAGDNPREYLEILRDLKKRCVWFQRVEVYHTEQELINKWQELSFVAQLACNPQVPIYASATRQNCARCMYQTPCLLALGGHDPIHALMGMYQEGKKRI